MRACRGRTTSRAFGPSSSPGSPPTPWPWPPPTRPEDPREYLVQWMGELEAALDQPGGAVSTFFGFETTYWRERTRPNLLLVHYDDLQADLAGEMRRISDFLGIDTPDARMPALVE